MRLFQHTCSSLLPNRRCAMQSALPHFLGWRWAHRTRAWRLPPTTASCPDTCTRTQLPPEPLPPPAGLLPCPGAPDRVVGGGLLPRLAPNMGPHGGSLPEHNEQRVVDGVFPRRRPCRHHRRLRGRLGPPPDPAHHEGALTAPPAPVPVPDGRPRRLPSAPKAPTPACLWHLPRCCAPPVAYPRLLLDYLCFTCRGHGVIRARHAHRLRS